MALMRQYALDYGGDGIRANAVNADRVRSGLLTEDFIKERAKARGVSEQDYMNGNLLGREVTADDVAQAFVHLALELKPPPTSYRRRRQHRRRPSLRASGPLALLQFERQADQHAAKKHRIQAMVQTTASAPYRATL